MTVKFQAQNLLRADAFPHPVDGLHLRETHISWVVLTGQYAYKIKKPVKFGFIDASTLEKRRELCEDEVRLNRRFAPELYLGVAPIVMQNGMPTFGVDGQAEEYAVRMRQFSEDDVLLALLQSRQASDEEIAAFGELIGAFHLRAPIADSGAAQSASVVDENSAELTAHLRDARIDVDIQDVVAWINRSGIELAETFAYRRRAGNIRECHGDLHAGNIVRYKGRLTPFDCIEFNSDLRVIDVIDDIAFLFMDLVSHARHDLAFVLLNRYLQTTGDYAGMQLLRFYSVYRALVRAKVDALALQAQLADSGRSIRLHSRVHAARTLMRQQERPALILMHGVSGSGKSWLSERLLPKVPAVRVRTDVERKRLGELKENEALDLYSASMNRLTYDKALACAQQILAAGFNVIVDATFLNSTDRKPFRELSNQCRSSYVIVSCEAPEPVLQQRITERSRAQHDVSDADLTVLRHQLRVSQPFGDDERSFIGSVDTSAKDAVDRALREIRTRMR